MHDSGKRQQFDTGAQRDTADDKPRPDLISPFALDRLGEWLRLGAEKYNERNWEQGIPISRSFASAFRHLLAFQRGEIDEDHAVAFFCNGMFILHTQIMVARGVLPAHLDDMPEYQPSTEERTMTPEEAITIVNSKAQARTRWEGQEPFLDEVLVAEVKRLLDSEEMAWCIIDNAYGGDWSLASRASGWEDAAKKWCDNYLKHLRHGAPEEAV